MSALDAASALPGAPPSPARLAARRARSIRPGLVLAALLLVFFVVAAIAPSLLTAHDPLQIDLAASLRSPSPSHLFGTDQSGRDVFARVVHGTRQSLLIGIGATALATALALALGLLAGLGGRVADALVSRLVEVVFAFPVLLLALLLVTVVGASASTEVLAVGIASAPGYARMLRGQLLAVRGSGYVEAALALGHPRGRIVRRHVLPNALRPLVVVATLGVGQSIVWASGLAFLGAGVAPPAPEWGAMLDAGRTYVTHAWWLEIFPGLAIVLFALSLTALGRYLQRRLEGGLSR